MEEGFSFFYVVTDFFIRMEVGSYSYLNDSIGSNLDAFNAGYNPETNPTTNQVVIPKIIHAQGIKNVPPIKNVKIFPIKIPKTIPTKPPN